MRFGVVLGRGRRLALRLLLLSAIALPNLCLAKEPGVAIQFDPNTPNEKVAVIWLGYLMARATYRPQHKLPLPQSGTISPAFDEEVYARTAAAEIYQELKEKDKGLHDPYWEILSQIKAKGFMKAYVWTYLRRAHWPKSQQPGSLSAFQNWSHSLLKHHKAVTYGSLAVERK
jgi:hypothetical protein